MSEHFIKNIEIKNFKCFEDFKAEGFGRVNLIGGKNNVGKTAFMEACYLSTNYEFDSNRAIDFYKKIIEFDTCRNAANLKYTSRKREDDIHDLIETINNLGIVRTNSEMQKFYTNIKIDNNRYRYSIQGSTTQNHVENYSYRKLVDLLDFNIQNTKLQYSTDFLVSSSSYPDFMFDEIISNVKTSFKYDKLNSMIYDLFKYQKIDILKGEPIIFEEKRVTPLKEFGQGMKSFIYNIASLLMSTERVLFIDEIENGIHYTNLDKLWEIILTISKEQNVQVFATTHSKECIESYARVAKKLEDEEISFIELGKNKNHEIKAMVYPYEWFLDEIEQNHEVRGW
jgi:AAA15 family ATPase/GTPase